MTNTASGAPTPAPESIPVTIIACDRHQCPAYPPKPGKTPRTDGVGYASLANALNQRFASDAHLQPIVPLIDLQSRPAMRWSKAGIGRPELGGGYAIVALFSDVDDPVAHQTGTDARLEWRKETFGKLGAWQSAHGGCFYMTRGGFRVVHVLPGYLVTTPDAERQWKEQHAGICAYIAATFGVQIDAACNDVTRLYRLPKVTRDSAPELGSLCYQGQIVSELPAGADLAWRGAMPAPVAKPACVPGALSGAVGAVVPTMPRTTDWSGLIGAIAPALQHYPSGANPNRNQVGLALANIACGSGVDESDAVEGIQYCFTDYREAVPSWVADSYSRWSEDSEDFSGLGWDTVFAALHQIPTFDPCVVDPFRHREPVPILVPPTLAGANAVSEPVSIPRPDPKKYATIVAAIKVMGVVRYDERLRAPVNASGLMWTDADLAKLREAWSAYGIEVGKDLLADAVLAAAHARSFDPVREYLDGLPAWDGEHRCAFVSHFGAAPGPWSEACWRVFSVSAVARVYEPGCKVDTMIDLEGDQGIGKSSGLRALCPYPGAFSDTILPLDDAKALIEGLAGVWIQEVAERSGLRGRDAERVKASLSSATDRVRGAYARFAEVVPRRSIFVASSNPDGAGKLTDPTGNRRHLPLSVTGVDLPAIRRDRDQIWAEALHRYRAGEPWWLVGGEIDTHADEAAERTEEDPWVAEFRGLGPEVVELTMKQALERVMIVHTAAHDPRVANRAARCLKLAGWKHVRPAAAKGQPRPARVYRRGPG